ncbi:DUF3558 family protein [Actinoalloteichus spitiensis]|uniref:DUF3558 family protein n=1 Tax=Actinoalloteichus spitiensis TaxID=252394 RepID=UPI00036309CD|nr:DUF3558 family protein [Actinoalloteichus spitiensis]
MTRRTWNAVGALLLAAGLGACASEVSGTAIPLGAGPGQGQAGMSEEPAPPETGPALPDMDDPADLGSDEIPQVPDGQVSTEKTSEGVVVCELLSSDELRELLGADAVTIEAGGDEFPNACKWEISLDGASPWTKMQFTEFGPSAFENYTESDVAPMTIAGNSAFKLYNPGRCDISVQFSTDGYPDALRFDLDSLERLDGDYCEQVENAITVAVERLPAG